jgi:hypothetical protein
VYTPPKSVLLSHHNLQRLPPQRHAPLQRIHLRHSRHKIRILALHPYLLLNIDLLPFESEDLVHLVVNLGTCGAQGYGQAVAEVEG